MLRTCSSLVRLTAFRRFRFNNRVPLHESCDNVDRIRGALRWMVTRIFDPVYSTERRTDDHLGDDEPDSGEPPNRMGSFLSVQERA